MNEEKISRYLKCADLTNDVNSMSKNEYLMNSTILIYLKDVSKNLMIEKPSQPLQYMSEYFRSILNGTNIINKEFSYIISSLLNRMNFIWFLSKQYNHIMQLNNVTANDLLFISKEVCNDFEESIITILCNLLDCKSDELIETNKLYRSFSTVVLYYPFISNLISYSKVYIDKERKDQRENGLNVKLKSTIVNSIINAVVGKTIKVDQPPIDINSQIKTNEINLKELINCLIENEEIGVIIDKISHGMFGSRLE